MTIAERIKDLLLCEGACDVGFCAVEDGPAGLPYAVSVVMPLSDAVIDEIEDGPTHPYFHHYRTVNAYIDRLILKTGLLLQSEGWRYMPVAASQSIPPAEGERSHRGLYSHKKAAVLAGLGTVGKSALFLHRERGPRVRLGTIFTDCPLPVESSLPAYSCGDCDLCVRSCPACAIKGEPWRAGIDREEIFDAKGCNDYMRAHFMKIGRGAVCGICVKVCPFGSNK